MTMMKEERLNMIKKDIASRATACMADLSAAMENSEKAFKEKQERNRRELPEIEADISKAESDMKEAAKSGDLNAYSLSATKLTYLKDRKEILAKDIERDLSEDLKNSFI